MATYVIPAERNEDLMDSLYGRRAAVQEDYLIAVISDLEPVSVDSKLTVYNTLIDLQGIKLQQSNKGLVVVTL